MIASRHVTLIQSADAARKKREVLVNNLAELVIADRLEYDRIDRTIKNIEILSRASVMLIKEANQPYTF